MEVYIFCYIYLLLSKDLIKLYSRLHVKHINKNVFDVTIKEHNFDMEKFQSNMRNIIYHNNL